jgi:mRNA deadenylase 3'-5' endonuclease subunit Ccr4
VATSFVFLGMDIQLGSSSTSPDDKIHISGTDISASATGGPNDADNADKTASSEGESGADTGVGDVRIFTYNVLSSYLPWGGVECYHKCKAEYLDPEYRLQKILADILDKETGQTVPTSSSADPPPSHSRPAQQDQSRQPAIICLQEVSHAWCGALHTYFAQRNYYFVCTLYGSHWSGYMGVGVAVPLSVFRIHDVDITCLRDTLIDKDRDVDGKRVAGTLPAMQRLGRLVHQIRIRVTSMFAILLAPVSGLVRKLGVLKPEQTQRMPSDVWELATARTNRAVCMTLSHKLAQSPESTENKRFVVGTYHIPCVMNIPSVMMVHCALLGKHIQNYARRQALFRKPEDTNFDEHSCRPTSLPFILCGDFNIKPREPMYELLTNGKVVCAPEKVSTTRS